MPPSAKDIDNDEHANKCKVDMDDALNRPINNKNIHCQNKMRVKIKGKIQHC